MTTINLTSEATFIELTRVYKMKGAVSVPADRTRRSNDEVQPELKTQPYTVAVSAIASVRPSNRLGMPGHRSTITLVSGQEIDLANKYSDVVAELTASA